MTETPFSAQMRVEAARDRLREAEIGLQIQRDLNPSNPFLQGEESSVIRLQSELRQAELGTLAASMNDQQPAQFNPGFVSEAEEYRRQHRMSGGGSSSSAPVVQRPQTIPNLTPEQWARNAEIHRRMFPPPGKPISNGTWLLIFGCAVAIMLLLAVMGAPRDGAGNRYSTISANGNYR